MKPAVFACLLCFAPALLAEDFQEPALLKVMLQGSSAAAIKNLVEQHGGQVSHELHIIDAVGATLTRSQLDAVLESSLVTRHIDDLSISEDPENPEDNEPECQIGGSLEITLDGDRLEWLLYNKGEAGRSLQSLEISWPSGLGRIRELRLGDYRFQQSQLHKQQSGELEVELPAQYPKLLPEPTLLVATFEKSTEGFLQRQFTISARFESDCDVKLIPGYPVNGPDSYFPTAAGADILHKNGVTGRGVTVAVLDSGLWDHPALTVDTRGETRIVGRYDAIRDSADGTVFDESGHGTHMTSVIARSDPVTRDNKPTGSFKGIAPDVRILAVKAFNEAGQGDFLDIVRGIQYVVDNRERLGVKVLNLSFAARPRWPYWDDPINQALMHAWRSRITVVAAAGNEGPEPMTIGSPGNLPYIITVGAVTDAWTLDTRDDDYIPDFSSRGPTPSAHIKPDLVAPGGHIAGITRPGSTLTREHPEYMLSTGEFVMTGTSQASALVSGIVALLLQLEPELTPDDVKCKLISSAEPAINKDGKLAYSPFQQGNGYVSASRAITLGDRGCANLDMDLARDLAGEDHYQGPAVMDDDGNIGLPGLAELLSEEEPAKGLSETRKWGAKEHIERTEPAPDNPVSAPDSFDWRTVYFQEKERVEKLAAEPSAPDEEDSKSEN